MRGRLRTAAALAVAWTAALACSVDVLDVDPPATRTVLSLNLTDHPSGDWSLGGFLYAGVSANGASRPIPDPVLRVTGGELRPDSADDPHGILSVVWRGAVARSGGVFTVTVPVVDGRTPGDLAFWTRPRADESTRLHLPSGSDLLLEAGPGVDAGRQPDLEGWTLELRGWSTGEENTITQLSSPTPVPDSIRIPAAWIPVGVDSMRADLTHHRLWAWESGDEEYRARVSHVETLRWRLVVDAPEGRAKASSR